MIIILFNLLTLKFCREGMYGVHGHIEIDIWKVGFPFWESLRDRHNLKKKKVKKERRILRGFSGNEDTI